MDGGVFLLSIKAEAIEAIRGVAAGWISCFFAFRRTQ